MTAPAPADVLDVLDVTGWTPISGRLGSNPGARYVDPDGVAWYLKIPRTPEHARSEVLAGQLYRVAGIAVPDVSLAVVGDRLGTASRWVRGTIVSPRTVSADLWPGFAMDCLLAAWDVTGFGNIVQATDGSGVFRIDLGGCLAYRARGGLKGAAWGDTVGELSTLRDRRRNPAAAAVYSGMSDEDVRASAASVLALGDQTIADAVASVGLPAELAARLVARRDDIARQLS